MSNSYRYDTFTDTVTAIKFRHSVSQHKWYSRRHNCTLVHKDCFELNPFHGLCKLHENDILKEEYPETSETEEPSSSDSAPVQTVPSTTSVSEIRDQPSNVSIHSVSDVADKPGTGKRSMQVSHYGK